MYLGVKFLFVLTPSPCGHSPYISYGNTGGEGDAIIRFLCCGHFLTCHFMTPHPIFFGNKTPRKATENGKGGGCDFYYYCHSYAANQSDRDRQSS